MKNVNTQDAAITRRVERLEASNRRYRLMALAGIMLIGLTILAGVGRRGARLIEAEGILLRGPGGELRGSFVVGDDGGVRLTMLDQRQSARAGIWLSPSGAVEQWGFTGDEPSHAPTHRPVFNETSRPSNQPHDGSLVTLSSGVRVLERKHDYWIVGYQLTLRNQTNRAIDEALYVTLLDQEGYVLAREPRIIEMAIGSEVMLRGEMELVPQRAEQVARASLAAFR